MLDRRFLDAPLGAGDGPNLGKDPRFVQAVDLAGRGSYGEAAALAEELLGEGSHDIRTLAHYFLGLFLQDGILVLTGIVQRVHKLLTEELAVLGPKAKKAKTVDNALSWMFRAMAEHTAFQAAQKSAMFSAWLEVLDAASINEMSAALASLRAAVGEVVESPQSTSQIGRLERWVKDTVDPLVRRRKRAAETAAAGAMAPPDGSEPQGTSASNADSAASAGDGDAANSASSSASRTDAVLSGQDASPALQALQAKLRAFETLIERGDMVKAAIVASDIREIIASFDPLLYLPKLFAGYVRLLARSIDELAPHWEESGSPSWQALEQFYRTDLDGFVGEPPR